jgi:hypothetical protein
MPSPLQRHHQRFDERNSFSLALLGLVGLARELDAAMPRGERSASGRRGLEPWEEAGIHCCLGLVVLRRSLGGLIEEWAASGFVVPEDADRENLEGARPVAPSELLR